MAIWDRGTKLTAITVYIVFIITLLGMGVGHAAKHGVLIEAGLPLGAWVILAFRQLPATSEIAAWAAMTGWLGMTYAHTGGPIETVIFFIYVALAALGVYKSAWFLAFAWLAHIGWDHLPRELPGMFADLPLACALFDGPIGLYLAYYAWRQRWQPS